MQSTDKELVIYYDNDSQSGRMALAYAYTLTTLVNKQEVKHVQISTTTLKQILRDLKLEPKELMNKANSYYQKAIRGRDFEDEEWLHILRKNPSLIKAPIVCYKGHTVLCNTPTDVFKLLAA